MLFRFDIYKDGYLSAEDDQNILQFYQSYDHSNNKPVDFFYQSPASEELCKLREYFRIDEIAGDGNDFSQQKNLMVWVHNQLSVEEKIDTSLPYHTMALLPACMKRQSGSDCFRNALVLNEIFLAMGFKSKFVYCLPLDLRTDECHCVVHVFSKTYHKWVIMDPSFCCFYIGGNGEPLSLNQLRESLIKKEKIYVPNISRLNLTHLFNYWKKNIIRFHCFQTSTYDMFNPKRDRIIYALNPAQLKITDKEVRMSTGFKNIYRHFYNDKSFWNEVIL